MTLPEGGIVHLIKQTVQIERKEMNQQREKKRRKSNLTEGEKKKKKRCGEKERRNCSSDMFVVHLTGINLGFCRVKQIFEASVLDAGKH